MLNIVQLFFVCLCLYETSLSALHKTLEITAHWLLTNSILFFICFCLFHFHLPSCWVIWRCHLCSTSGIGCNEFSGAAAGAAAHPAKPSLSNNQTDPQAVEHRALHPPAGRCSRLCWVVSMGVSECNPPTIYRKCWCIYIKSAFVKHSESVCSSCVSVTCEVQYTTSTPEEDDAGRVVSHGYSIRLIFTITKCIKGKKGGTWVVSYADLEFLLSSKCIIWINTATCCSSDAKTKHLLTEGLVPPESQTIFFP